MSVFTHINPATGEKLYEIEKTPLQEVESIIAEAEHAQINWRSKKFSDRVQLMHRLAEQMELHREPLAKTCAIEMGKPIQQARAEINKCVATLRYWRDETVLPQLSASEVILNPLGIIFGIMPWNFPYWQVIRCVGPALLIGNTVIIKHAPNTLGCQNWLQKMFAQSGFPKGVFSSLHVDTDVASKVIADSRICGVSFTGSPRGGSAVAQIAGKALKKTVLELGGSDAYIVLDDADVERAATTCVFSRLINSGQSCVAAKRFIVTKKNHDVFLELVIKKMSQAVVGDPLTVGTEVGPLARGDLRQELHQLVQSSAKNGARIHLGGTLKDGPGFYYLPTVMSEVTSSHTVFQEETFGPVAAIIRAASDDDAIVLANRSRYGLGAAIFTNDAERARALARNQIKAGMVFINDFVKSDAKLPFGGIGESGYGRELGTFGFQEFANIKIIVG